MSQNFALLPCFRIRAVMALAITSGTRAGIRDAGGHVIVHFSKKRVTLALGDRVRASFVVQSHQEYNGTQQNIAKKFRVLEKL